MEKTAKIKLNLDARELEIEGTEEFVNSHSSKIESFLEAITKLAKLGGRKTKLPKKVKVVTASSAKVETKAVPAKRGRKPGKVAGKAPVAKKVVGKRGRPAKAAVAPTAVAATVLKPAGKRGRPASAKKVTATKATAPKAAKPVKVAKAPKVKAAPKAKSAAKAKPAAKKAKVEISAEFLAFFKRVPRQAKDIDKMLAVSHYLQTNAADGVFTAKDVNALLGSQGVKLSNAAQYVKNSIKTKRMVQVDRGKFKLSADGIAHVNSFLAK